jgi:hypothetical protein
MNRKIISISMKGSDYVYRQLTLGDIADECFSGTDEITLAGFFYNGHIIVGLEEDFYHCHLKAIGEDILSQDIEGMDALYFTLFYSEDYKNSGGRDEFEGHGGILLEKNGWGLWPFSSENAKNTDESFLTEEQSGQIAEALESLPNIIFVER